MISTHSLLHWSCLVLLCSSNVFSHARSISTNENEILTGPLALGKRSSHFHSLNPEGPMQDPENTPSKRARDLKLRIVKEAENLPRLVVKRNSSSTAPPIQLQGTHSHVPDGSSKNGFSLTGGDIPSIRTTDEVHSQPFAVKNSCSPKVLTYESRLGGDVGLRQNNGVFLPLDNVLLSEHVEQGEVGDCSIAAAMKSLLLTGYEYNIRDKLRHPGKLSEDNPFRDTMLFIASFYREDGSRGLAIIDDGLPRPCDWEYYGFRPVKDVFFFPLLEKALAKFVDEYPLQYRQDQSPDVWGYRGLESVRGAKAIRAIIGGTPQYQERTGLQARTGNLNQPVPFINRFKTCIDQNIPCVTGLREFRKLDEDDKTIGLHLDGFPTDREYLDISNTVLGGMKATVTTGWTIENVPFIPEQRPGIYLRLKETSTDKSYIFIVNHAYAVSRSYLGSDYLMVSNPWNRSPTLDGTASTDKGEYHLPLSVAAALFSGIEWVQ